MLARPRTGAAQQALETALATLGQLFHGNGYETIDVPHLFLGETLLDLYGEDLRARAFLFPDAERANELCLRPDFTVPVALAHGAEGWDRQAGYSYAGPVFRRQPEGLGRPTEYMQAGVERFGDRDPVVADAEIFYMAHEGLAALGIGAPLATIGDLSIPFALLDALDMPAARRRALRRHFWRPRRFQALIDRAVTPPEAQVPTASEGAEVLGRRTVEEVAERLARMAEEASAPAMPKAEADLIGAILAVEAPAPEAAASLRRLTTETTLTAVLDRFEERLAAIARRRIDPAKLIFDANFGRNLEYYDGFVFEMRAPGGGEHPPLAGGGRYDAMTLRLGATTAVHAVGGIVRPDAALAVLA